MYIYSKKQTKETAMKTRIFDFWDLMGREETLRKFNITDEVLDKILLSYGVMEA